MENRTDPPELLDAAELARRLRLTPQTVIGWANENKIPSLLISKKARRYEWAAVLEALRRAAQSKGQGAEGGG